MEIRRLDDNKFRLNGKKVEFLAETEQEEKRLVEFREHRIVESFVEHVPGRVVWDVGANIGLYSMFASTCDPESVLAMEPERQNFNHLHQNLSNAHSEAYLKEVALSDYNGKTLIEDKGDAGEGAHYLSEEGDYEVRVQTGRNLLNNYEIPEVLKVDVEGDEMGVMLGFGHLIKKIKVIYFEEHKKDETKRFGHSPGRTKTYLENKDFIIHEVGKSFQHSIYRALNKRFL